MMRSSHFYIKSITEALKKSTKKEWTLRSLMKEKNYLHLFILVPGHVPTDGRLTVKTPLTLQKFLDLAQYYDSYIYL